MEQFTPVAPGISLLKIPFGPVWTGVILVRGESTILIDSGASASDVDHFIIPALEALGLTLEDVDFLVNTHSHGDHIGGNYRLRQLGNFETAAYETTAAKISDPVPYAIATRTAFPEHSPIPQSYLQGIPVDHFLSDGETVAGRLQVIHTPGHDNDCVCWYDVPTKTLITGDSLQANGTISQGVGFYKSLSEYRYTLEKLSNMDIENILCGHDYDGIGYWIPGKAHAVEVLNRCQEYVDSYHTFIQNLWNAGIQDPVQIARSLITEKGCGMPEYLFMALYTVTEHLKHIKGE